jgi:pimeloyl-ACP methyl ester carboxylesterase
VLSIVTATLPREAHTLSASNLIYLARKITTPTMLILGSESPPWAEEILREHSPVMRDVEVIDVSNQGHNAIDTAPREVVDDLVHSFTKE